MAAPPPRYEFTEGQTNVYKVTLETEFQESPVELSGILFTQGIPLPDGNIHFAIQGQLMPAPPRAGRTGRPPGMAFMGTGNPMGFWMPRPIHLPPGVGETIDRSGLLVRGSSFTVALPTPFESMASLLIEPLPEGNRRERSVEGTDTVPDDLPYAPGNGLQSPPMGFYPGRTPPRLPVQRTGTTKIIEATDRELHLQSTLELTSLMKAGTQPRLAASIQRKAVFDRTRGRLTSLELTSTTTLTTPNFSLRRPVTIRVRLLEGAELARELESRIRDNPETPRSLTAAELEGLISDATSSDPSRRNAAATRLMSGEIKEPTPSLLAAATRMAADPDISLRAAGHRILGLHGGEAEVPAMIRALPWSAMGGNQRELLSGLRRLRDPRALDPIADTIARGTMDVDYAAECLQEFGSAAEPAALRLIQERHAQTRRLACQVLGRIGSAASLNAVRELVADPDPSLSQAAGEALRAIQARTDSPPNP